MEPISPATAAAGGLLIGSAAALFLLLTGRIAGVSGMTAVATRIGSSGTPWSQATAFVIGLPLGTTLIAFSVRTPGPAEGDEGALRSVERSRTMRSQIVEMTLPQSHIRKATRSDHLQESRGRTKFLEEVSCQGG